MKHHSTHGCRVLTCCPVEQGSEVDRVKSFNNPRNERFFGSLRELEGLLAHAPDILGGLDMDQGSQV